MKKLMTTTQYALWVRGMTTTEICKEFDWKLPKPRPTTDKSVIDFLAIDARKAILIMDYAKFVSTPLELGQFIPCKDGVPLEEPIHISSDDPDPKLSKQHQARPDVQEYQKALAKVLFEGWELKEAWKDMGISKLVNNNVKIGHYHVNNNVSDKFHLYNAKHKTIEDLINTEIELVLIGEIK